MSSLTSTVRQLIVPVLFAAVAGVTVALLVGGVDIKGFGGKIGQSVSGISNLSNLSNLFNPSSHSVPSSSDYVAVYMENGKVYWVSTGPNWQDAGKTNFAIYDPIGKTVTLQTLSDR